MSEKLIGQEIEAYCGKCKTDTMHLITAIDEDKVEKVMCKVCMRYHKYKKPAESTAKPRVKKTKAQPAKKKTTRTRRSKWPQLLEETNYDSAVEYKMDKNYEIETPIHHKSFGLGIVKDVIDSQKIKVLFHDGEKIMVQNYHQ